MFFPKSKKGQAVPPGPTAPPAQDSLLKDILTSPWRILKGLGALPYKIGRGEGVIPKPVFGGLIKAFFYIIGILVILGIIVLAISSYLYGQTGIAEAGYQRLAVGAEEAGVNIIAKLGLEKAYYALFKPEKLLGPSFESNIETTTENKDLGVRFTKLETTGRFFENEPITVIGTINAQSIDEDLDVEVTCNLEDYEGGKFFPAEVSSASGSGNPARVFKGFPEIIQATCTFPNGLSIENSEQLFRTERSNMYATYDFKTLASMKLYLLNLEVKKSLALQQLDPFKYYGISESLLKSDNTMRSKATKGPINLGIGTYQSQPFSENIPYWFGVAIKNNIDWQGNLFGITSLELMVPPNMILESDAGFRTEESELNVEKVESCAFEPTGYENSDGSKIYTLKSEILEYVNRDCSKVKSSEMSEQECIDLFKTDLEFRCRFMLTDVPYRDIKFDFVEAEAKYKYKTEKSSTITVRKLPTEAFEETTVPTSVNEVFAPEEVPLQ